MLNRSIIILLFVSFIAASSASAQTANFLFQGFTWQSIEHKLTDARKLEMIEKIDHWLLDLYREQQAIVFDLNSKDALASFHVLDFNGNGLLDMLYYGPAGAESFLTLVLVNQGNGFAVAFEAYGAIVNLWRPFPFQPFHFIFSAGACCNEPLRWYTHYQPVQGDPLTYAAKNKTFLPSEFNFPEKSITPIAFTTINETYTLRRTAYIPEERGETDAYNVLAQYPKGSEGVALAKQIDATGREWWLVMMRNNKGFTSDYKVYIEGDEYYFLGWMSSRYLQKL